MTDAGPTGPGEIPAAAGEIFGSRLPVAERFADLLCGAGVERGLIGPREVPEIWHRHLLNCAVVADAFPVEARVVDVGSGAGLPGLALAIRRPDLRIDLVEPLLRRATFLSEAVADLGLSGSVRVVRGRSEDREVLSEVGESSWVTARAVAPLARLVRWCVPLLVPGGTLVAMKGSRADDEVSEAAAELRRTGSEVHAVREIVCGSVSARVVEVVRRERATSRGHRGGAKGPR